MRDVLLIDLGKTTCRASVGRSIPGQTVRVPGAPGLAAPGGVDAALAAIRAAAGELGARPDIAAVGAAGALADPDAAATLAERLVTGLGASEAVVASDVVMAHVGGLQGRPGVVVVAGTGVAALAVDGDGGMHLVDGAGPTAGDRGGGGWIGAQLLEQAERERAEHRSGPMCRLAGAAFANAWPDPAGSSDSLTGPGAARQRARVVPAIDRAASSGDAGARALLAASARAIAATTLEAVAWMPGDGAVDVCAVGGLLELGPAWHEPLEHALRSDARVRRREPEGGPLDGALLLARITRLPHERFVHREFRQVRR